MLLTRSIQATGIYCTNFQSKSATTARKSSAIDYWVGSQVPIDYLVGSRAVRLSCHLADYELFSFLPGAAG